MRALAIIAVLLFAAVTAWSFAAVRSHTSAAVESSGVVSTSTSAMQFEIATTPAQQQLGLGKRPTIPDNYGMLFVFAAPGRIGFWMKDMLVPIDIIWLSDTGTVLGVEDSVSPMTYPNIFYPPVPVKYVLETRAGYARDHGWTVSTHVPLPAPYGR